MKCYLMDVDGTVADAAHRLHYIQNKPKNWPAFFDAAKDDAPIEHMRPLVQVLLFLGCVVYVSGRPERLRDLTQDWLRQHSFNLSKTEPVRLYMRPDGDFREDSIVKFELLQQIRADGYFPQMAFDDRTRVVNMWRSSGVPCLQVAPGDF